MNNIQWDNMNDEFTDEDYEDLFDCLTDEEKEKIAGKGFFGKIIKRFRDKRQAKNIEKYDAMIDNIENGSIQDTIPDEYKNNNVRR